MRTRIYSLFLALYPAWLRNTYGAEMIQVFGEDLEDSYRTRGLPGAAAVWYRSLKELIRIALPARAAKREIAVALITYGFTESYFLGIVVLEGGKHIPRAAELDGASVLVFGVFPAVIAYVALRIGNRSMPVPLDLRRR